MPRQSRTIQVAEFGRNVDARVRDNVLEALRTLRPLGIRFSQTTEDGGTTTVNAWRDEGPALSARERDAGQPAPAGRRRRNRADTAATSPENGSAGSEAAPAPQNAATGQPAASPAAPNGLPAEGRRRPANAAFSGTSVAPAGDR